jgi:hypothetical protein
MISIEIDAKQLKALQKAVERSGKKFAKELAAAINDVARKTKVKIGKDVRTKVEMSVAESKKPLKAKQKATAQAPTAIVSIAKTRRLGLQHFKAKQDKSGVSYKINKQGGRQRIEGAFRGPKPGVIKPSWGGIVLQRVGKAKTPIVHILGVSAFGVYAKNNMKKEQTVLIRQQLTQQMERRIKLNILRAEGLVAK